MIPAEQIRTLAPGRAAGVRPTGPRRRTAAPGPARRRCLPLLLLLLAIAPTPPAASGRPAPDAAPPPAPPRPRLFLDCHDSGCDAAFLRRELPFVDWARDREDADVHVLVTGEATGDGGHAAQLCFLRRPGRGPAADTLRYFLPRDATADDARHALARALAAGLARDLVGTPEGQRLEIRVATAAAPPFPPPAADPWRAWVLSAGVNGSLDGERSYRNRYLGGSLAASRVTATQKLGLNAAHSYSEGRYTLADGSRFTSINRAWSAGARGVRSLARRWSAGARGSVAHSTFGNVDLTYGAGPTVEFSLFPYAESARRSWILAWETHVYRAAYARETIYGQLRETLWYHRAVTDLALLQPWGSTGLSVWATQYLHDGSKYSVTAIANAQLRLCRGLSLTLTGSWSRVHDQLALPRGDASDEEIIARRRELATACRYGGQIGLTYTFGAAVNNVVNTRLEDLYGSF
ncbi:MAG: hypothetical protein ACYDIE_00660 [Candidatus Krumholzibacteriia bacterium]